MNSRNYYCLDSSLASPILRNLNDFLVIYTNTNIAHRFCRPQHLTPSFFFNFSKILIWYEYIRESWISFAPKCRITNLQVATNLDLFQIFRLYSNRNPNEEEIIVRSGCYLPRTFYSVRSMASGFLCEGQISKHRLIYSRGCFWLFIFDVSAAWDLWSHVRFPIKG